MSAADQIIAPTAVSLRLRIRLVALLPLVHLLAAIALGTAHGDHWLMDVSLMAIAVSSDGGARFVRALLPVWLTAVMYVDILPHVLPYRGEIHIGDLYEAERRWFGVETSAGRVILCDLFHDRQWRWLDGACGAAYLGYQPLLVLSAAFLYFRDPPRLRRLLMAYFLVHVAGFTTYVLYPAAPPWYVEQYGRGPARFDVPSNPAGVARFDELTGLPLAREFYSRSTNIFGAMPSLHIGLAMLFPLVTWTMGWRWFIPGAMVAIFVAIGGVYFQHHYVLDLIVGAAYAVVAYAIAPWFYRTNRPGEGIDSARTPVAVGNAAR